MLKQILQILSGNGLAQLIQFSALFILLKLYSPAEFSDLAISQSIATFIAVFFTLQLNHTIPITKLAQNRNVIYSYVIIQIGVLASICSLLVFFIYGINEVLLGVILGLLLAFYNLNLSLLGANQQFSLISKVTIFRAMAIVSLQYLFSGLELSYSIVLAVLFAETLTQFMFFKSYAGLILSSKKIKKCFKVIYAKYRDFYVYGVFAEVTAIVAFTFPLYFIDYHFGNDVSGNYGMAYRLVWGPIVLLTSSICQVVYTRMGRLDKKEAFSYLARFRIRYILIFLLLLFFFLYLFKPILNYIFSDKWNLAAELIPIICVWGGAYISVSLYRLSYRLFHLQKELFYIDFSYLLVLALFSFCMSYDIYLYITFSLFIYFVSALITIIYIRIHVRKFYDKNNEKNI